MFLQELDIFLDLMAYFSKNFNNVDLMMYIRYKFFLEEKLVEALALVTSKLYKLKHYVHFITYNKISLIY